MAMSPDVRPRHGWIEFWLLSFPGSRLPAPDPGPDVRAYLSRGAPAAEGFPGLAPHAQQRPRVRRGCDGTLALIMVLPSNPESASARDLNRIEG